MKRNILLLIIGLLILSLGIEGYVWYATIHNYSNIIDGNEEVDADAVDVQTEDNITIESDDSNDTDEQIEDTTQEEIIYTKPTNGNYIYDASYENGISVKSYVNYFENTYYLDDLKVPYINIDSTDGKIANEELEDIYYQAIEWYKDGLEYGYGFAELSYQYSLTDDYLSVLVILGHGGTDITHYTYYTYNFDLNTGNFLTYEELYTIAEFTADSIKEAAIEAITEETNSNLCAEEISVCVEANIKKYNTAVSDGTILSYLDSSNNLYIITPIIIPVGNVDDGTWGLGTLNYTTLKLVKE